MAISLAEALSSSFCISGMRIDILRFDYPKISHATKIPTQKPVTYHIRRMARLAMRFLRPAGAAHEHAVDIFDDLIERMAQSRRGSFGLRFGILVHHQQALGHF